MAVVTMKQLLEAGVHFGHQTRRWNPKMRGSSSASATASTSSTCSRPWSGSTPPTGSCASTVADGGTVLFVGTKKQAQEPVQHQAERCGMPYVNYRWLGGMLTNFQTVHARVAKLRELERLVQTGETEQMLKKEALKITRELAKLERNLGGIRNLERLPERDLRDRHEEGAHRRHRGQPARHPRRRGRRHQLRPRRHRLRHPRQRRRHPLRQPDVPGHRRRRRGGPFARPEARAPGPATKAEDAGAAARLPRSSGARPRSSGAPAARPPQAQREREARLREAKQKPPSRRRRPRPSRRDDAAEAGRRARAEAAAEPRRQPRRPSRPRARAEERRDG